MNRLDIILKSEVLEVTKINKKTRAKMFKNLKVGSKIMLSIPVEYVGGSRRGTYASNIEVKNIETGEVTYKSFNELPPLLDLFEFKVATDAYRLDELLDGATEDKRHEEINWSE